MFPVRARHKHKNQRLIHDEDEAACKIQAVWRGRAERKELDVRKAHRRPGGFYTHTLASTLNCAGRGRHRLQRSLKRKLYLLLEVPASSSAAMALGYFIIGTVLVSVVVYIVETVPEVYRESPQVWFLVEVFCSLIFTLEYLCRIAVCDEVGQSRLEFVITPLNMLDLFAILPFYIEVLSTSGGVTGMSSLQVIRGVRLFRVFRMLKIGRYARGMRLMGEALMMSVQPICVLVFLICVGALLFSSAVFQMERVACPTLDQMSQDELKRYGEECADDFNRGISPSFGLCCAGEANDLAPVDFQSVIGTVWWSMVTMTAVGYGDVYPKTLLGKTVGFGTVLVGMVLIALPAAIVGQKFQELYELRDIQDARQGGAQRMRKLDEVWTLVPASDVLQRVSRLRPKHAELDRTVYALTSTLDEVWEQREQLIRARQLSVDRQRESARKLSRLTTSMMAYIDSPGCQRTLSGAV